MTGAKVKYYVQRLDCNDDDSRWEQIESSWEYSNPSQSLETARDMARRLATRANGSSKFRVVSEHGDPIHVFFVSRCLVHYEIGNVSTELLGKEE